MQRPLKSTSSNDEGISEMDPTDSLTSSAVDLYSVREGQMLGAKAEMLKVSLKVYGVYRYLRTAATCLIN